MLTREEILTLLDEMIEHQRRKVLDIARKMNPHLTPEDLRNFDDFPDLRDNPRFNFEDGILAGYLSARTALLAELNQKST
ncbi:MAG TPA: hypothetical protein PK878_05660 [bacterium]|nr:hypothetical protein [bacterium]HXK93968.1 hypothetical protein [bacterium]